MIRNAHCYCSIATPTRSNEKRKKTTVPEPPTTHKTLFVLHWILLVFGYFSRFCDVPFFCDHVLELLELDLTCLPPIIFDDINTIITLWWLSNLHFKFAFWCPVISNQHAHTRHTGIIMCLFGFQLDGIHKWINLPSDRWMERTEQMRMIIIKWNMTNYYYSFNGWLNSLTHIGTIPTLDANPHEFNSWFSTLFPVFIFWNYSCQSPSVHQSEISIEFSNFSHFCLFLLFPVCRSSSEFTMPNADT